MTPILGDASAPLDVIAFAAISLGLVYVGSCNEEVAQAIIFALMDRSESELGEPLTRLLPLGLGLLYLGKQVIIFQVIVVYVVVIRYTLILYVITRKYSLKYCQDPLLLCMVFLKELETVPSKNSFTLGRLETSNIY